MSDCCDRNLAVDGRGTDSYLGAQSVQPGRGDVIQPVQRHQGKGLEVPDHLARRRKIELEAAGIEPACGQKPNRLAPRDFGRIGLQNGRLPTPSPFRSCPLESPGVPPSRGGILEAAGQGPASASNDDPAAIRGVPLVSRGSPRTPARSSPVVPGPPPAQAHVRAP